MLTLAKQNRERTQLGLDGAVGGHGGRVGEEEGGGRNGRNAKGKEQREVEVEGQDWQEPNSCEIFQRSRPRLNASIIARVAVRQ